MSSRFIIAKRVDRFKDLVATTNPAYPRLLKKAKRAIARSSTYLSRLLNDDVSRIISASGGGDSVTAGPTITFQPYSQEVYEDQDVTFFVVASGATSYQWQRDTGSGFTNIGGATSATYTKAGVTVAGDDGDGYRCRCTNANGTTISNEVTLTVFNELKLSPYLLIDDQSERFQERVGPTTPSGDGDVIGTIYDRSGNDRHFTAISDAARPLNQIAEVNSRAAIQFDGTADSLKAATAADWTFLHDGTSHTIFIVAKCGLVADPDAAMGLIATRTSGASVGMSVIHETRSGVASNRIAHGVRGGTANVITNYQVDETTTANAYHVIMVSADPDNESIAARSRSWTDNKVGQANNIASGAVSTGASANALYIGSGVTGAGVAELFTTGLICEVCIFNSQLSEENRVKMRDYLYYKWGLGAAAAKHVGDFGDLAQVRNIDANLTVGFNSPARHASSPVYTPGALNPAVDVYYPAVVKDGSTYLMYGVSYKSDGSASYVFRLTSADGITWSEQDYDLITASGNTNNTFILDDKTNFFVAEEQDGSNWIAGTDLLSDSNASARIWSSADGLSWSETVNNDAIAPEYLEGRQVVKDFNGFWMQFYVLGQGDTPDDREIGFFRAPTVDSLTGTWVNCFPFVLSTTDADQKYGCCAKIFDSIMLLPVWAYEESTGLMEGDLYVLRDLGKHTKIIDQAFPRNGTDAAGMVMPTSMIQIGNLVYIYGTISVGDHTQALPRTSKACLWTIGVHRWAQISGTGTFETEGFRANAAALTLNCDASSGSIKIEVLDNDTSAVMTNYAASQFTTISSAGYAVAAAWGVNNLPADRTIRLRFHLNNATLYSWTAGS